MSLINLFFIGLYSFALTPQQYCEKLHAKRPPNVTTSYELLNVDIQPGVMISGTGQTIETNIHRVTPPAPFQGTYYYSASQNYTFEVGAKVSKYCEDGNFRFKSERTVAALTEMKIGYAIDEFGNSIAGTSFGTKTHVSDTNDPSP